MRRSGKRPLALMVTLLAAAALPAACGGGGGGNSNDGSPGLDGSPGPAATAYLHAGGGGAIASFRADPATGALVRLGTTPVGEDARLAELDRRGRRLYVQTQKGTPHVLLMFDVDAAGKLTRTAELPLPYPAVEGITQMALHPTAPWFLYSATNRSPGLEDQLLPVGADGQLGPQRTISLIFYGFGWDPPGKHFYGLDGEFIYQYAFDAQAGDIAPLDPPHAVGSTGRQVLGLRHHPNGRWVYSVEESELGRYGYDPATGALVGQAFFANPLIAEPIYWTTIELHASGRFLYAFGKVRGTNLAIIDVFTVDGTTGELRWVERETGGELHQVIHRGLGGPLLLGDWLYTGGPGSSDRWRGAPLLTTYRIASGDGALSPAGDPLELDAGLAVNFIFATPAGP
jgi:hypothetical protein